jgi:hypothetical protein
MQVCIARSNRKNSANKILLVAQTLIYHSPSINNLTPKGGGIFMATKKAAAKKPVKKAAKKKK